MHDFLTPYTRKISKWIKDLNIRPKTIKLLKENIGSTLFDICLSNIFGYISTGKENKTKYKLGIMKLKNFPIAMETINKAKTYLLEWEKIFSNDKSDKELIATNINSTSKKQKKTQLNKIGRGLEQTFFRRRWRWLKSIWKDAQNHYSLGKCKSKPHTHTHTVLPYTCQNGCFPKNNTKQVLVRMWKEGNPLALFIGGIVTWCPCCWKWYGDSSKNLKK